MEKGFFHADFGYWQTNSLPSAEVLASYPLGTIEVPIKPGADFEWAGGAWVHVPQPAPVLTPEDLKREHRAARAAAYRDEADPLFFKWQAGEATEAEWLDKRAEIRARYPYAE